MYAEALLLGARGGGEAERSGERRLRIRVSVLPPRLPPSGKAGRIAAERRADDGDGLLDLARCRHAHPVRARATERCGERHDGVMHIDHGHAADMPHRWQLMHPCTIVALIISIVMSTGPAMQHERSFDMIKLVARNENIDIGKHAARRARQFRHDIGGALQQHEFDAGGLQCRLDVPDFLLYSQRMALLQGMGPFKMAAWWIRHGRQQILSSKAGVQATQQISAARLANQQVPFWH